ncbi:class D sortase [Enterococcus casseliflavus]|uniref:class D sortase n=1 Tax=Enterococcus casseliflavus TaxID=37734 RepID=UPI003DA4B7F3
MVIAPIVFLIIGYSLMYVIGKPVIQFITSSVDIILLNEAPNFDFIEASEIKVVDNEQLDTDENNELPSSTVDYPSGGTQYGKVKIDALKMDVPLYFGDTAEILRLGAGQFMGSVFPGELGTTLIGGHNTDTFGKLIGIHDGTEVEIQTTYGNYVFKVVDEEIKNKADADIQTLIEQRDKRVLLLYTCYPIDSYQLGLTDERMFVTCEYVSGPIINEQT